MKLRVIFFVLGRGFYRRLRDEVVVGYRGIGIIYYFLVIFY